MPLTKTLRYNNMIFHLTAITATNRIYTTQDELTPLTILTAVADHDGVLMAMIDERLRESVNDDMIRCFDFITGDEE